MSARRIIVGLVIIAILAIVVIFVIQRSRATQEQAAEAETLAELPPVTGNTGVVAAEGRLAPLREAGLSFPVGGIVAEILVEDGDAVETGTPLIRLQADALEIALGQAQAGLTAAEAQLESAQAGLEAARAGVTTAELAVSASEAQLALLNADPLPEEIASAEDNIAAAQAAVSQASGNQSAALNIPESQIRAAEANVASAMAEYESLDDTYTTILNACFDTPKGEICPLYGTTEERVRAELEIARLKLDAAQAALDSLNAGATSGQRQAAAGAVTVAQANQRLAEAQLELLLADPSPEEVRQAEVQVEQAQATVEQAQVAVEQAEAAVQQAEAGVVNAQGNVDEAQAALDRMTLKAVFDGTVADVDVELGQLVALGQPIVQVADLTGWQVETTDLKELDVALVNIGDPVDVSLDAIPDEVVSGTVTDIARFTRSTGIDVNYVVVILLDERPDLPLRWGMTANVEIDVE